MAAEITPMTDEEIEEIATRIREAVPLEERATEERFKRWAYEHFRTRKMGLPPTGRQLDLFWRAETHLRESWEKYGIRPRLIAFPEHLWGKTERFAISGMRGWFGREAALRIREERRRAVT